MSKLFLRANTHLQSNLLAAAKQASPTTTSIMSNFSCTTMHHSMSSKFGSRTLLNETKKRFLRPAASGFHTGGRSLAAPPKAAKSDEENLPVKKKEDTGVARRRYQPPDILFGPMGNMMGSEWPFSRRGRGGLSQLLSPVTRLRTLPDIRDEFNEMENEIKRWFGDTDEMMSVSVPRIDVAEYPTEFKIHVELPGMEKDDVTVEVNEQDKNNPYLVITAVHETKKEEDEKTEEEEKEGAVPTKWHMKERTYNSFRRSFSIPERADLDGIDAKLEKGVLEVIFKKKDEVIEEEAKAVRKIPVSETA